MGDKGYDAYGFRDQRRTLGLGVCVPPKRNRVVFNVCNETFYRIRYITKACSTA